MAGRFSVEAVFKAVDRMTAPVTRMQNRVGRLTRSMERGFRRLNRTVNTFGRGIKRGAQAAAISIALVGGAMGAVLGPGAQFEQAITNVGAVSLKSRDQIADLEKQALQLGRTTKFTATQAANAMEVLARAGFNSQEILKATPAVLSAAAASGLEIAEVANHVSNVLKGMGLETSEAARVADVLALASARTNSSIGSLGESMKNAASTARKLGVPLEDAVASVALLQDVGLDASVAGSAFNVMLTKMATPSAKITKIMRRMGISFKDSGGNMKALPRVIADINKASKAMGGNFDQVAFLAELVGLRGQKAASNLADLFESGKLQKLTKELNNAAGSAKKMADIRMATVGGSMLLLGSAVDAVKVKIFGLNEGPLRDTVDRMTAWVSANEDLIATRVGDFISKIVANLDEIILRVRQVSGLIAAFIALSAVIKIAAAATIVFNAASFALGATVAVLKGAFAAYTFIAAALPKVLALAKAATLALNIAFAANPIGLMVIAIAALIAIGAAVIVAWDPVKQFFIDLWSRITDVVSGAGAVLKRFGSFFGFGGDDDEQKKDATGAQVVSPQERAARQIDEQRTTSTAEVTLKDETGRAEVTGGSLGAGVTLQPSGAF